jgi:hypothetical protein
MMIQDLKNIGLEKLELELEGENHITRWEEPDAPLENISTSHNFQDIFWMIFTVWYTCAQVV